MTENKPDRKPTSQGQLKKWANEVRLMRTRDKRDPAEIESVIRWCQADSFWQENIESIGKLRKQYDRLCMKWRKEKEPESEYGALV